MNYQIIQKEPVNEGEQTIILMQQILEVYCCNLKQVMGGHNAQFSGAECFNLLFEVTQAVLQIHKTDTRIS